MNYYKNNKNNNYKKTNELLEWIIKIFLESLMYFMQSNNLKKSWNRILNLAFD